MSKQVIGIGAVANDGTGDNLRTAFGKVNANADELFAATPGQTGSFTATVANNSAVLSSVSDFTNIAVGREITGTSIEAGAVVSSFNAGAGTVTLSKQCKTASPGSRTCTVAIPYGAAGAPAPARGVQLTDSGWDYPNGYAPLFNYRPSQLRKFLVQRGAAIAGKFGGAGLTSIGGAGAYSTNILVLGDSKVIGNTPLQGSTPPKRKHSPYNIVASILNAMGHANWQNNALMFGFTDATVANYNQWDPRVAIETPADWSYNGADPSVTSTLENTTTTTYIDFTPEENTDGFDIYVRVAGDGATAQFSWAIGAGSATTLGMGGSGNNGKLLKFSVSATLGANTLRLRRVAGTFRLVGVVPKNSTVYSANIINCGINGSNLAQRDSRTTSANSGIGVFATHFAPSLAILQFGYVDIGDAADPTTSVAATIGYYGNEIDRWKAQSVPVLIVSPSPWDDVNLYKDDASQRDFLRALRALCVTKDVPMINMDDRWGSWQEASAAGFLTHYARPDQPGNADMGFTIARAIAAL